MLTSPPTERERMSANVRVLNQDDIRMVAQQDPLANRLRTFGQDLKHAKALVADLTTVLKRMDEEAAALNEAGVTMTYTLGPIGDAAAACRRDLHRERPPMFKLPTREDTR
jgi:hypothetical protein